MQFLLLLLLLLLLLASFIYYLGIFTFIFCIFLTLNESSCNASNFLSGINIFLNHILFSQLYFIYIFKVNQVNVTFTCQDVVIIDTD